VCEKDITQVDSIKNFDGCNAVDIDVIRLYDLEKNTPAQSQQMKMPFSFTIFRRAASDFSGQT
jgi:hypothetical protein